MKPFKRRCLCHGSKPKVEKVLFGKCKERDKGETSPERPETIVCENSGSRAGLKIPLQAKRERLSHRKQYASIQEWHAWCVKRKERDKSVGEASK